MNKKIVNFFIVLGLATIGYVIYVMTKSVVSIIFSELLIVLLVPFLETLFNKNFKASDKIKEQEIISKVNKTKNYNNELNTNIAVNTNDFKVIKSK